MKKLLALFIATILVGYNTEWINVIWFLMGIGLLAFVIQTALDAGRRLQVAFARQQYNLTQENYTLEQHQHGDPTRPISTREDLPLVIELERQYRKGK